VGRLGPAYLLRTGWPIWAALAGLSAAGVIVGTHALLGVSDPLVPAVVAAGGALVLWFATTRRVGLAFLALGLYLGIGDGPARLLTGVPLTSTIRDLLLYALAGNVLVRRWQVSERRMPYPWLLLGLLAVALAQMANPSNGSIAYSIASLRPHLEWLPLTFLGFTLVRSSYHLRILCMSLVVVVVANAIVGAIQFQMSPDELARWGPGYRDLVSGTDRVSGRSFYDAAGNVHVRPFGLGPDTGFGGNIAMLAIPAALALLMLTRTRMLGVIGTIAVGVAAITSQSRSSLVGVVFAVVGFVMFTARARRPGAALVALALSVITATVLLAAVANNTETGVLDRYRTILPGNALGTAVEYRGFNVDHFIDYAGRHPLGAGLGVAAPPASSIVGGTRPALTNSLDAESEFTFLLIELGFPGLLIMACLFIRLVVDASRAALRIADHELKLYLSALAAAALVLTVLWIATPITARTPTAPMFWLLVGVVGWWGRHGMTGRAEPVPR
jgi:hypothetical protein